MYIHSLNRPYSYRFPFRKSHLYLIVVIVMLVMSWESQRVDGALVQGANAIPDQAIRLRILANSDSAVDQAMKRRVRDAVVEAMDGWANGPQTLAEARSTLKNHMGEIEQIVGKQLNSRGFSYPYHIELGQVSFPTKIYGENVYPAGKYESLLITLGSGEGQNWWCVLFPPLCFIDSASGETAQAANTTNTTASNETQQGKTTGKETKQAVAASADNNSVKANSTAVDQQQAATPEVKFFVWELLKSIISFIRALFA